MAGWQGVKSKRKNERRRPEAWSKEAGGARWPRARPPPRYHRGGREFPYLMGAGLWMDPRTCRRPSCTPACSAAQQCVPDSLPPAPALPRTPLHSAAGRAPRQPDLQRCGQHDHRQGVQHHAWLKCCGAQQHPHLQRLLQHYGAARARPGQGVAGGHVAGVWWGNMRRESHGGDACFC